MKISFENAIKNWKAFLIIILFVQTVVLLLYKICEIKEIFSFSYSELSAFITAPVFFLYLYLKKENS